MSELKSREQLLDKFKEVFSETVGDKAKPVFIDPEQYNHGATAEERLELFKDYMEREHPGILEAYQKHHLEKNPTDSLEDFNETLSITIEKDGAGALSHIHTDAHNNTVLAFLPDKDTMSAKASIAKGIEAMKIPQERKEAIMANTTMSDETSIIKTALHEARHALQPEIKNPSEIEFNTHTNIKASMEVDSEQFAIDKMREKGVSETEIQQTIDLRVITATATTGKYDQLGPALDTGSTQIVQESRVSYLSVIIAAERCAIETFGMNSDEAKAFGQPDLVDKNPDLLFSMANKAIEKWKQEAEEIKSGLSGLHINQEEAARLIELQSLIDTAQAYEGAHRRMAMGQDFKQPERVEIITPEERQKYIEKYQMASTDTAPEGAIVHNDISDVIRNGDALTVQASDGGAPRLSAAVVPQVENANPTITSTPTVSPDAPQVSAYSPV